MSKKKKQNQMPTSSDQNHVTDEAKSTTKNDSHPNPNMSKNKSDMKA